MIAAPIRQRQVGILQIHSKLNNHKRNGYSRGIIKKSPGIAASYDPQNVESSHNKYHYKTIYKISLNRKTKQNIQKINKKPEIESNISLENRENSSKNCNSSVHTISNHSSENESNTDIIAITQLFTQKSNVQQERCHIISNTNLEKIDIVAQSQVLNQDYWFDKKFIDTTIKAGFNSSELLSNIFSSKDKLNEHNDTTDEKVKGLNENDEYVLSESIILNKNIENVQNIDCSQIIFKKNKEEFVSMLQVCDYDMVNDCSLKKSIIIWTPIAKNNITEQIQKPIDTDNYATNIGNLCDPYKETTFNLTNISSSLTNMARDSNSVRNSIKKNDNINHEYVNSGTRDIKYESIASIQLSSVSMNLSDTVPHIDTSNSTNKQNESYLKNLAKEPSLKKIDLPLTQKLGDSFHLVENIAKFDDNARLSLEISNLGSELITNRQILTENDDTTTPQTNLLQYKKLEVISSNTKINIKKQKNNSMFKFESEKSGSLSYRSLYESMKPSFMSPIKIKDSQNKIKNELKTSPRFRKLTKNNSNFNLHFSPDRINSAKESPFKRTQRSKTPIKLLDIKVDHIDGIRDFKSMKNLNKPSNRKLNELDLSYIILDKPIFTLNKASSSLSSSNANNLIITTNSNRESKMKTKLFKINNRINLNGLIEKSRSDNKEISLQKKRMHYGKISNINDTSDSSQNRSLLNKKGLSSSRIHRENNKFNLEENYPKVKLQTCCTLKRKGSSIKSKLATKVMTGANKVSLLCKNNSESRLEIISKTPEKNREGFGFNTVMHKKSASLLQKSSVISNGGALTTTKKCIPIINLSSPVSDFNDRYLRPFTSPTLTDESQSTFSKEYSNITKKDKESNDSKQGNSNFFYKTKSLVSSKANIMIYEDTSKLKFPSKSVFMNASISNNQSKYQNSENPGDIFDENDSLCQSIDKENSPRREGTPLLTKREEMDNIPNDLSYPKQIQEHDRAKIQPLASKGTGGLFKLNNCIDEIKKHSFVADENLYTENEIGFTENDLEKLKFSINIDENYNCSEKNQDIESINQLIKAKYNISKTKKVLLDHNENINYGLLTNNTQVLSKKNSNDDNLSEFKKLQNTMFLNQKQKLICEDQLIKQDGYISLSHSTSKTKLAHKITPITNIKLNLCNNTNINNSKTLDN